MSTLLTTLDEALRAHVVQGDHLHFASTPSRSNTAIRALARAYRTRRPEFTLSTSGFHSSAHLLGLLRLGKRYIACFFGDNAPQPRPNALYETLREEGATLELWSLLAYVEAFRAGALGHDWGIVRSLGGSDLGRDLERIGRYREVPGPEGEERLGLVRALRSDVTFLHAPLGDEAGNVVFNAPSSEGLWSAWGAKKGVIVTVERLARKDEVQAHKDALRLPRHKILAVCEAPFGTHPQPLLVPERFRAPSLKDDFEHYALWRRMAQTPEVFAAFEREVLDAPDGDAAYRAFVGEDRLFALRRPEPGSASRPGDVTPEEQMGVGKAEALVLVAARLIAKRVKERGHTVVLAGIGQGFIAAKLAKSWLEREGVEVRVVVETGLDGIDCTAEGESFLLGYRNMAHAERLTSVEEVLGVQVCGADNRCLGVLSAAEVDAQGDINSSYAPTGRLLVGSGGANDIASSAAEVVVVVPCDSRRLVERVAHVTSPGRAVTAIATEQGVLRRVGGEWVVEDSPGEPDVAWEALQKACGWPLSRSSRQEGPAFSDFERTTLRELDPEGMSWARG